MKKSKWDIFKKKYMNEYTPILDEYDELLTPTQEKQSIYQTEIAKLKYKIRKIKKRNLESDNESEN